MAAEAAATLPTIGEAAAAVTATHDEERSDQQPEGGEAATSYPWTRGSSKTLRTALGKFAEKYSNELVTTALDGQAQRDTLARRGTRDDSGRQLIDARWKLVGKSLGMGNQSTGLFSVASDASRLATERSRLKALQKRYDEEGLGESLKRLLKEAISQEQRRTGLLLRTDANEALAQLQTRLAAAMEEVGGDPKATGGGETQREMRKVLVALNELRFKLNDTARVASLCTRVTHRLNDALAILAQVAAGGGSAHATVVTSLFIGVHGLSEDWRAAQLDFDRELKRRAASLEQLAPSSETLSAFVAAAKRIAGSKAALPPHTVRLAESYLREAAQTLGPGSAAGVLDVVLGIMRCFAKTRQGTWFDDHVKVMLVNDSARLAWLQSQDGEELPERSGTMTDAQRRANAGKKAAQAKRSRVKKMKRLDDQLWGQVAQYEVAVKTSDKRGAGTDANVHIVLYGVDADSGEIPLYVAGDSGDKFERDALDVFIVNSLWVGEILKLRVGHDAVGLGSGWHLERIIVHDCLGHTYFFPCDQWLDTGIHNSKKQINRELVPLDKAASHQMYMTAGEEPTCRKLTTYHIKVFTGSQKGAGTDANVRIMLFGEFGYSGPWILSRPFHDDFERGKIDDFQFEAACLGKLYSIQIGHDGTGSLGGGADWYLEQVAISDTAFDELFIFPCKRWLGGKMGGGDETAEVLLTCVGQAGNNTAYEIDVTTGDKLGAGTDSHVKIRLYGTERDSGWHPLEQSMTHRDKFEARNTDKFLIEVPYLGDIKRCTICHDGWGLGAGWYLDRIKVKNIIDGKIYEFPCDRWLDSASGDRQIMRDLIERKKGSQHLVPGIGLGKRRHLTKYKVIVITGMVKNAGTDANVNVVFYGEHGRSGPWRLKEKFRDLFEKGKMDTFTLELAFLGELKAIKIGHDGKRPGSAWYLETVFVSDELNGGEWEFECRSWLDEKLSQDGKRVKVLPGRRSNFSQQTEWAKDQSKTAMTEWLNRLNLGKYASKFEQHEIDPDVLPAITDRHLIAMGMPLEERSRMLAAIVSHALSARLPVYLSILVLPYRVEGIDLSVFLMFFSVASGICRASAALLCII